MSACRRHSLPFLLLVVLGCTTPLHTGNSPLRPAQMSPDSVVLELFFVRFPFGDPTINGKLWDEIDEQLFPVEVRERLACNGFRAGVVNGQMPMELSKLLELSGKPAPGGEPAEIKLDELDAEPRVLRRHMGLRNGHPGQIFASGIYPQLHVLVCQSGEVGGQSYNQAQGIFAIKSSPQPDGRVRLELVPELHHGQHQQRWVGHPGMFRLDTSRPKQVFDDMTLIADLIPGSMLVLSSLPNREGSLGHHFFSDTVDRLEQKLLIVRVSQTQHDGLFNPPGAPTAEE